LPAVRSRRAFSAVPARTPAVGKTVRRRKRGFLTAMPIDATTITVLTILFFTTLIRAVFGFGNALIAMPLLAMTSIGLKTAAPLIALIAVILSLLILVKDWRSVDIRSTWRLLLATIPGIPLGIALLKGPHENTGKIILAALIIGFSAYSLLSPRLMSLKQEWTAYPFGFIAGILGGAYSSNGPPVVIYGTLRRWPPECLRATLQGYFLPSAVIIAAGHGLGGLWTPTVGWYCLISLPVLAVSMWLGGYLNRAIPQGRFDRYIHILLVLIGALLFVQTAFA
jgi:uncharacterized protein